MHICRRYCFLSFLLFLLSLSLSLSLTDSPIIYFTFFSGFSFWKDANMNLFWFHSCDTKTAMHNIRLHYVLYIYDFVYFVCMRKRLSQWLLFAVFISVFLWILRVRIVVEDNVVVFYPCYFSNWFVCELNPGAVSWYTVP